MFENEGATEHVDAPSDFDLLNDDTPTESTDTTTAADSQAATETQSTDETVTDTTGTQTDQADTTADTVKADTEPAETLTELIDEQATSPKALLGHFSKNQAFKAAVDASPELKNALFAMARRSTKLAEIQAHITTPEQAKFAIEQSNKFAEFENALHGEPGKLLEFLYGQKQDVYQREIATYRKNLWGWAEREATKAGDQEFLEAMAVVRERLGDGGTTKKADAQTDNNQLSPDVQRELEEGRAARETVKQQQTQAEQAWSGTTLKSIDDTIKSDITTKVGELVKDRGVALSKYTQDKVVEDTLRDLHEIAGKDPAYQNLIVALLRQVKRDDEGRSRIVTEARKYATERLGKVVTNRIREATAELVQQQQNRNVKRDQQTKRVEVKGAGGVTTPSRQDAATTIRSMEKQKGKRLSDLEILEL